MCVPYSRGVVSGPGNTGRDDGLVWGTVMSCVNDTACKVCVGVGTGV